MTRQQEDKFEKEAKEIMEKLQVNSILAGAEWILKSILNMCNEGKSTGDVKTYCENLLSKKENK